MEEIESKEQLSYHYHRSFDISDNCRTYFGIRIALFTYKNPSEMVTFPEMLKGICTEVSAMFPELEYAGIESNQEQIANGDYQSLVYGQDDNGTILSFSCSSAHSSESSLLCMRADLPLDQYASQTDSLLESILPRSVGVVQNSIVPDFHNLPPYGAGSVWYSNTYARRLFIVSTGIRAITDSGIVAVKESHIKSDQPPSYCLN